MFLNWDFGISNRILCLHPRIRPWKLPFHFCLTLKMLQHSAWCKVLALLSYFLTLKPSWCLKDLSESVLKRTSDWGRAQNHCGFPSCLHPDFFFPPEKKHFFWSSLGFTPVIFLSTCQVQLVTSSSSDHYKTGPRRKEMPFLYIKIKLELMYLLSI